MDAPEPWFPDFVAWWYDEFRTERHEPEIAQDWRWRSDPQINAWAEQLLEDPHATAVAMDAAIATDAPAGVPNERRYRALQAASRAIGRAGIHTPLAGGSDWYAIRAHWKATGSLARDAEGLLLPRRTPRYGWEGARPDRPLHDHASHFDDFLRWNRYGDPDVPEVRVRVLPGWHADLPASPPEHHLTVAVVPLIATMDDLDFQPLDDPSGRPAFRVSLKNRAAAAVAADLALERAAHLGCDIVLFPELCLTPEMQETIGTTVRRVSAVNGGRPWIVVAGSAHTEVAGRPGKFHNRAVVLGLYGQPVLHHHKLHEYLIRESEQDRYNIADALGHRDRVEDIVTVPRVLEVLETPIGRLAVLICEDLSVKQLVIRLVKDLELDWLLVPVMDGVQASWRWTTQRATDYAEEGVRILIGTCTALVDAHRESLARAVPPEKDPGRIVGLFVRSGRCRPLRQTGLSHEPLPFAVLRPSRRISYDT